MKIEKQILSEVEKYLNSIYPIPNDSIVVLDDETIVKDGYYVFFYTNKRYLETNNLSEMMVGNAPVIVDKKTGSKHFTGTSFSIDHYMGIYEKENM